MKKYYPQLLKVNLFSGFNENTLDKVLTCTKCEVKKYKKGEAIFLQDDKVERIGVVLNGKLVIRNDDYEGNSIIIDKLSENSIFGEAFVGAKIERSLVSVWAVTDVEIFFINYSSILNVCGEACTCHTLLINNMITVISRKLLALNQKVSILQKSNTREKVLTLLNIYKTEKKYIEIPFSREEMAEYIGVNRSALSRELSKMQEDGIISFNKNKFKITL